ncbi:MAG: hypothetical protein IT537_16510 [Hyphomicrobiales bacterium]|nr:hypothetical protein [Hyphomicrobiales bacterium]
MAFGEEGADVASRAFTFADGALWGFSSLSAPSSDQRPINKLRATTVRTQRCARSILRVRTIRSSVHQLELSTFTAWRRDHFNEIVIAWLSHVTVSRWILRGMPG